jgi:hypothetical protein
MTTKRAATPKQSKLKWTNNATIGTLLGGLILASGGYVWNISSRLTAIELDIGKMKQRIADGGTHEIVKQLNDATKPSQIAAQMAVIKGEIQLAQADGKKPDQEKIRTLTPALTEVARKFPDVSESWSTISTLASYRTASIDLPGETNPAQMPDCNAENAKEQLIEPQDIGLNYSQMGATPGYLFKNCRLYLDRLPGHSMPIHIKAGNPSDPTHGKGGDAHMGFPAFAVGAIIVWRGELSDTNIIRLQTLNCKFEFDVRETPSIRGQKLLLAALESPTPGSSTFSVK